jgi:hypothetical protein
MRNKTKKMSPSLFDFIPEYPNFDLYPFQKKIFEELENNIKNATNVRWTIPFPPDGVWKTDYETVPITITNDRIIDVVARDVPTNLLPEPKKKEDNETQNE